MFVSICIALGFFLVIFVVTMVAPSPSKQKQVEESDNAKLAKALDRRTFLRPFIHKIIKLINTSTPQCNEEGALIYYFDKCSFRFNVDAGRLKVAFYAPGEGYSDCKFLLHEHEAIYQTLIPIWYKLRSTALTKSIETNLDGYFNSLDNR